MTKEPDHEPNKRFVDAQYLEQPVPNYNGNPFIEALPPIRSREDTAALLAREIEYRDEHRNLPVEIRQHLVAQISGFYEPLFEPLELDERMARMIRIGYLGRNPVAPRFYPNFRNSIESLSLEAKKRVPRSAWASATSMDLIGISGIGKSSALEASLNLYPQVIRHSEYDGRALPRKQLTWLKLDCSNDGSIKGLCNDFFEAVDELLDTTYRGDYVRKSSTVDMLVTDMARVAYQQGIGVLVIDEIQHLSAAKSGGEEKMLNFFTQLVNTIGLPLILVGTYRAMPILGGEFRQARRGGGQGDFVWDRMVPDSTFRHFCTSLWEYQYVRKPTPLDDGMLEVLYEESQGVTDILVKLFILAQHRAMLTKRERLEPNLITSVAKDSLRLVRPILQALKHGDDTLLSSLDDVLPFKLGGLLQTQRDDYYRRLRISGVHKGQESPGAASNVERAEDHSGSSQALPPASEKSSQPAPERNRGTGSAKPKASPKKHTKPQSLVAMVLVGRKQKQSGHTTLKANGVVCDLGNKFLQRSSHYWHPAN